MKEYEKIELKAKNSPSGSYAAGCPSKDMGYQEDAMFIFCDGQTDSCVKCERTH